MLLRPALLVILCLAIFSTQGQNLAQTLENDISALRNEKIDSVIHFIPPAGADPKQEQAGFIFYQRNRRLVAKKITTRSVSKEIALKDDSLFDWLRKNVNTLKEEDIHPFIWQTTRRGAAWYEYIKPPLEEGSYTLGLYGQEGFSQLINPWECRQYAYNAPDAPVNLNYSYNIGTRLYAFYCRLKRDAASIGD